MRGQGSAVSVACDYVRLGLEYGAARSFIDREGELFFDELLAITNAVRNTISHSLQPHKMLRTMYVYYLEFALDCFEMLIGI